MTNTTLSKELEWRGFINQTTFEDIKDIDTKTRTFYLGVDPSADSMQIGNLAIIMFVRQFVKHGHKAVLLVGGATGLIGDPDGKTEERNLKTHEEVTYNKQKVAEQFKILLQGADFELVDNYDWFKGISYLEFLRDVGKHVPMRQMLGRDFVQKRLGEEGAGISYAEFSYSLIQGYDFLHLYREKGVTLQICGADQWGNSVTGVDLVRRVTGGQVHVLSAPLIVNKATGVKFGKSEGGAVWLDSTKTSPTEFYQFWMNVPDEEVEGHLKIYTDLSQDVIAEIVDKHMADTAVRYGQQKLAMAVTTIVHGAQKATAAQDITKILTGVTSVADIDMDVVDELKNEIGSVEVSTDGSIIEALVTGELAASNTEARRLITGNAISINGTKVTRDTFELSDFANGRLLLRKGKKFKDSVFVESK